MDTDNMKPEGWNHVAGLSLGVSGGESARRPGLYETR